MAHQFLQHVGHTADHWVHSAQNLFQGLQCSIEESVTNICQALDRRQQFRKSTHGMHVTPSRTSNQPDIDYAEELAAWRKNPEWEDVPAQTSVTVPKGSLCQLDGLFRVGMPPQAVYNILIDPENKRVFKNIQEVKYRKILEDYGSRQVVEVEQAAIWRFLWLSGMLSVCVKVDQDQDNLLIQYELAREGFMKSFEGSWSIKPLYIDAYGKESTSQMHGGRVASEVKLHQVVQLALLPPPPFSWYIRGITVQTTQKMLEDLQAEGKRLRKGVLDPSNMSMKNGAVEKIISNDDKTGSLEAGDRTVLFNRHWKSRRDRHRRRTKQDLLT